MKKIIHFLAAILIIWGIFSYAEIAIHQDDYITNGQHYQYSDSNLFYLVFGHIQN